MEVRDMKEKKEIREIVIECINNAIGDDLYLDLSTISDTDPLRSVGLNSLNTIKVIISLEEQLGIELEDEDISMNHWRDIASIIDTITRRINHEDS